MIHHVMASDVTEARDVVSLTLFLARDLFCAFCLL